MTTPSPITRGTAADFQPSRKPESLAPLLNSRYVIVDVGTEPLSKVEPEGDAYYLDYAIGTSYVAMEAVRESLAVMQAIHDRDAAPEPTPAPRPYRVGDVIASNAEPEPPRTAVLMGTDKENTLVGGDLGWSRHGPFIGASWDLVIGFPLRVVHL